MPLGTSMLSPWQTKTPSGTIHTLSSLALTTLSSSHIERMDRFSFGAMAVSIQPELFSLISPLLRVYLWQMMKRSLSRTEVHSIEWRDGHRLEHSFHRRCQPVRSVVDSSLIRTMISTVQNSMLIKCCAARWGSLTMIVAGTGAQRSTANTLNGPWGIFVTNNFDLYVADYANDRIQLFRSGELQGRPMAGNGSNEPAIALYRPTGVVLDQDGYLFIVDNCNHRIIGSDRWGFRCVVGCSGGGTSVVIQLNFPVTMNFDSNGNHYVLNVVNHRVQKFFLATNSCDGQGNRKKEDLCESNSL